MINEANWVAIVGRKQNTIKVPKAISNPDRNF